MNSRRYSADGYPRFRSAAGGYSADGIRGSAQRPDPRPLGGLAGRACCPAPPKNMCWSLRRAFDPPISTLCRSRRKNWATDLGRLGSRLSGCPARAFTCSRWKKSSAHVSTCETRMKSGGPRRGLVSRRHLATTFISAWVRDASRTSFPREKEADVTYGVSPKPLA